MSTLEKKCSACKETKPLEDFYPDKRMRLGRQSQCKECARKWHHDRPEYVKEKNRLWKEKNPDYNLNWARKRNYGLSPDDVQELREKQDGLCQCGRKLSNYKECVDHDHVSGRVRGLLCNDCNLALGYVRNSPDILRALAKYLEDV